MSRPKQRLGWQAMPRGISDLPLSRRAKAVLKEIVSYCDRYGVCWPSQATLARGLSASVDTVQRALDELEGLGPRVRIRGEEPPVVMTAQQFGEQLAQAFASPVILESVAGGPLRERDLSRLYVLRQTGRGPGGACRYAVSHRVMGIVHRGAALRPEVPQIAVGRPFGSAGKRPTADCGTPLPQIAAQNENQRNEHYGKSKAQPASTDAMIVPKTESSDVRGRRDGLEREHQAFHAELAASLQRAGRRGDTS
jgi:hypothetical protein